MPAPVFGVQSGVRLDGGIGMADFDVAHLGREKFVTAIQHSPEILLPDPIVRRRGVIVGIAPSFLGDACAPVHGLIPVEKNTDIRAVGVVIDSDVNRLRAVLIACWFRVGRHGHLSPETKKARLDAGPWD